MKLLSIFLFSCFALLSSNGAALAHAKTIDDDFDAAEVHPVNILLFMFFGLCLGIIVTQLLARFDKSENVPYTVVIFVLGALISQTPRSEGTNAFVESVQSWLHIDAELILFVFLPPLIFGEVSQRNKKTFSFFFFFSFIYELHLILIDLLLFVLFQN